MRLKSVFISAYKNLKDFSLTFDGTGFVDIFVGKNGSGKSNFFEALIMIFDHIYSDDRKVNAPKFNYAICWEINGADVHVAWQDQQRLVNGRSRVGLRNEQLPSNIIIYYSGQNTTVAELVNRHRARYRRRIKNAPNVESPHFFGIGSEYKSLLLSLMLMLPVGEMARQFLVTKLGIEHCGETVLLTLSRPTMVAKSQEYDPFDERQAFWGSTGLVREFLDRLVECIPGNFTRGSLYDRGTDTYTLGLDVERFRQVFSDPDRAQLFSEFNALHTLGMIKDISLPIHLNANTEVSSRAFSDGQFQSVYIFAISEIFKNRNCITLLDEPDAFLHPEWQFDFLKQTHAISDAAAKTNHILMSSHSASTIAAKSDGRVRSVETVAGKTEIFEREKGDLIKTLSAGLITFSEKEACLNVEQILENTNGPVLFVEGISDVLILKDAWNKLYPEQTCPVEIVQAFDCSYLRNLFRRQTLYDGNPGRKFFALFDFDAAYQDWVQLGQQVETDVTKCLTRQRQGCEGYAMLLPVPAGLSVRNQVINPNTGNTYEGESRLTIELLLKDVPALAAHFAVDPADRAGWIKFQGDKVQFAQTAIPPLDAAHLEVFRPIFAQIQSRL